MQQNAYHKEDTYVPLQKQFLMMKLILHFHHRAKALIAEHVELKAIRESGVPDMIVKVKYDIPNSRPEQFGELTQQIDGLLDALRSRKKEVL